MPGIIVGIDGSHHSQRALEVAIAEAALRHAPLTVLTVHQVVAGYSGHGVAFPGDDALADKARQEILELSMIRDVARHDMRDGVEPHAPQPRGHRTKLCRAP